VADDKYQFRHQVGELFPSTSIDVFLDAAAATRIEGTLRRNSRQFGNPAKAS
jgi:hypothetical protein